MRTRSAQKLESVNNLTTSSPGITPPVVNIHIHMHSPSGPKTKTMQPIVHLHLDSLTKGLLPSIGYPNLPSLPTSQKTRGRKRKSLSITLNDSQYSTTTSTKKYGKRTPRRQANNNKTLDSTLDSFNPIYTSSQAKWNSTDNLAENNRICDGVLDMGDSRCDEAILNDEDMIDCSNCNIPKSTNQNELVNQSREKESESDSSRSNLTQMSLRSSSQVQRIYSKRNIKKQQMENKNISNGCVINKPKDINLKEAVVVLTDIYKDKSLLSPRNRMRITNITSLHETAADKRERNKVTNSTVNGKNHSEDPSFESSPGREADSSFQNTSKNNLNEIPVALSSDAEYQSPRSSSDSEPEPKEREKTPKPLTDNDRRNQSNVGRQRKESQTEIESGHSEAEDLQDSYNMLLNVSRQKGGLYAKVYTPEKQDKRIVIQNEALSIMDNLNFTELRQVIEANESEEEIRVSCRSLSSSSDNRANAKDADTTQETIDVVSDENDKEEHTYNGNGKEQEVDDDDDDDSDSGKLEVDLTVQSENDEPEGSIVEIAAEKSRNGMEASQTQPSGSQVECPKAQTAQSAPAEATLSTSESEGENTSRDRSAKKRKIKTRRKKYSESSSSSSEEEEEKKRKVGRWKKHFFCPDLLTGTSINEHVSDRMESPELNDMDDMDDISHIGREVSSQVAAPQRHERRQTRSKSPEKSKIGESLRASLGSEARGDPIAKDGSTIDDNGAGESESSGTDESSRGKTRRGGTRGENCSEMKENELKSSESSSTSDDDRNLQRNGRKTIKRMDTGERRDVVREGSVSSSTSEVSDAEKDSMEENSEGLSESEEVDVIQKGSQEELDTNGKDHEEEKNKKENTTKARSWDDASDAGSESGSEEETDGEDEREKEKTRKRKGREEKERSGSEETTCTAEAVSTNLIASNRKLVDTHGQIAMKRTSLSPVKEKVRKKEDTGTEGIGEKSEKSKKTGRHSGKEREPLNPEPRCSQENGKCSKKTEKVKINGKGRVVTEGNAKGSNSRKKDLNDIEGLQGKEKRNDEVEDDDDDDDGVMGLKKGKIKKPKKSKDMKRKKSETKTEPPAKRSKSFKGKPEAEKGKAVKKSFEDDNYLCLDVAGPTKFAVANLEKLKPQVGHDATTFKERMLFGDRVKRFSGSKSLTIGKMKQRAGMSCKR